LSVIVFGCGYVGLVTAVCLARMGHIVQCVDIESNKVAALSKGTIPFYEPGLKQRLVLAQKDQKISFVTRPSLDAEICIIAVGTPLASDGSSDLTQIYAVADTISEMENPPKTVIVKSTVPPGTTRNLSRYIQEKCPNRKFDFISNPEFLRQGNAVEDFQRPDRVVVGADSAPAFETVERLYDGFSLPSGKFVKTDIETAELTKYAANSFLTTKIAFMNELAGYCEKIGANIDDVAEGMGLDARIGPEFLRVGPGIGGSCFPKDIQTLSSVAQERENPLGIVDAVIRANRLHLEAMSAKVMDLCGGNLNGLKIVVFGVTFKANTDDLRNSPAHAIIPALQKAGAKVTIVDPVARKNAGRAFEAVVWEDDPYLAASNAEAIVILTEWDMFRTLDLEKLAKVSKEPRLADLRNLYDRETARKAGFKYTSVGR